MTSIFGIPLIILGIFNDGVNSLNSLALICMTFICALCGIKRSLTKKSFCSIHIRRIINHWYILYKLSFTQNNFLHHCFYHVLNLISLMWLFYKIFVQHLLPHTSNKSILHFIINLWTFYDPMSFNSIESTNY